MIDESMDGPVVQAARAVEFRSKPGVAAPDHHGRRVTVNLLLGMLIYIGILWVGPRLPAAGQHHLRGWSRAP